jgi:hypothetical protein
VYAASPRFSPDFFDPDAGDLISFGKTALSLRLLGKKDMMEVLRVTPMCVADWLNEWFENDLLKAGLAAPGLEGCFAGPWSSGTVTNLLWMESTVAQSIAGGPADAGVRRVPHPLRWAIPVRQRQPPGGRDHLRAGRTRGSNNSRELIRGRRPYSIAWRDVASLPATVMSS